MLSGKIQTMLCQDGKTNNIELGSKNQLCQAIRKLCQVEIMYGESYGEYKQVEL